jgi:hypothetical protein
MANDEVLSVKEDVNLYKEILALAHHLFERSGRIEVATIIGLKQREL